MMICPRCRNSNVSPARFCTACGASLAATLVEGRTLRLDSTRIPQSATSVVHTAIDGARDTLRREVAQGRKFPTAVSAGPPEDVFIVTDVSGSMDQELDAGTSKIAGASRAGINLVLRKCQVDPNDRIGLVTFCDTADVLLNLSPCTAHKAELIQKLQSLTANGGTDIAEGLKTAQGFFDWSRNEVVRRIVLLTDGHGGKPESLARKLHDKGVVIDVIGIGPSPSAVNEARLRQVASTIDGMSRYRFIKDSRTLVAHYTQLGNKTRIA